MKTIKQILIEGRKNIEKGWTRKAFARAADGHPVNVSAGKAWRHDTSLYQVAIEPVCFCTLGAVRYASEEVLAYADARLALLGAINLLFKERTAGGEHPLAEASAIASFNDDPATTREDVLKVFDLAIEMQTL